MTIVATMRQPHVQVLSMVSSVHFMSHFYGMTLAPLLVFIHNDLGISYTFLGLLMSMQQITSGVLQLPVGFAVDRFGAKLILFAGLVVATLGIGLIAFATAYWMLAVLVVIYGIGNSVFHPADYAILNSSINETRMGRSFSFHTFCGHIGTAIAPTVMLTVTAIWNWRAAIILSGILGMVVMVLFLLQWRAMRDDVATVPKKKKKQGPAAAAADAAMTNGQLILHILKAPAILYLFLFFCMSSLAGSGFRNFAIAGLLELHGTPVEAAGGALSGFLFASALGVLIGGYLADKTSRHDLIGAISLMGSAILVVIIGLVDLHYFLLVAAFTLAGLVQGIIRPARDMMIRNAAPKGAQGRVFGFVFSGQSFGGGIAPLTFGIFLDLGMPVWIFFTAALFMVLCMTVMLLSARSLRREVMAAAAE
jgi:FSR family fosmidomycin resistance protein-like MFS transporter